MTKLQIFPIAVAAALASFGAANAASTIYSNIDPAADQHAIYATGSEYGDEIVFDGGYRTVETFRFDYKSNYDLASGGVLRIYDNLGDLGAPKNLLFESNPFDIKKNATDKYNVVTLDLGGLEFRLPNDRATWTVTFSGIGGSAGNEAGILLYDAPTVGSSKNDFWVKNGSIWSLQQVSGGKVSNFAAEIVAVPEPSTYALLGLGAFAMVAVRRFRK